PTGADTTFIVGNIIRGDSGLTRVGGISVSSLLGGMQVNVVMDSNLITGNRYGITMYGATMGLIRYNDIGNNNLETNPLSGGSGISLYSNTGPVIATGNIITGNLWGITLIGTASVNLGDTSAANYNEGRNIFYDNGNGGSIYALYNNTSNTIPAM